jgi:hypothetical protein
MSQGLVGTAWDKGKGQAEHDLAFFAQMEPQVTRAPALFCVAGGARACGHYFLLLLRISS